MLSERRRAVVRALVATFAPAACDAPLVANAVENALGRLAAHRRAPLETLLDALATPWPALLAGAFAPFPELPHERRERCMRAMCDAPLPALRTAFQAFKRLCCFMAYAAHDETGANPLWPALGYPGALAGAQRGAAIAVADPPEEADVVVIGSGAGGAVAAAAFARAGRRVAILEAGPLLDARAPAFELDAMAAYYLESGLSASDDLGVAILAGAAVGGGTAVNWCTSLPLPRKVAAQWRAAAGGIDFEDLAPHYAAVRERLGVAATDAHNANNGSLVHGCRALGWHVEATPRNAAGCADGCGYCGFGCRFECKRSADATYLRDALARGATLTCDAVVDRAIVERGAVTGLTGTRVTGGRRTAFRVRAPLAVVAAGALRTPGILARSGVRSPHLGRHLHLHPTTAVFAGFDEPIETWRGPMQTAHSDAFADLDAGYGAKLEVAPAHPGLAALAIPWRDRASHAAVMAAARNAAAFIVLTRDRGAGAVTLDGRADVRYRLDPYDAEHMREALRGALEVALAAGATSVMTLHAQPLVLRRDRAGAAARREFAEQLARRSMAANRIGVFSAHQMGTCRMHRDPRRGVVDELGRVHGMSGLVVADGSVFPLSSGVNPMLTIMALASRTATAVLGQAESGSPPRSGSA